MSRHSLFSQRLDRAVFLSYLIGGIAPIGALFWVVRGWVLPAYQDDPLVLWGWVGGLASLGTLTLAIAFALRHLTSRALARMDADNRRQAGLLAASRELARALHAEAILDFAAHRAVEVTGARVAVAWAASPEKALELRQMAGDGAAELFQSASADALALAQRALEAASVIGESAPGSKGLHWLAMPLRAGAGGCGALLLAGPGSVFQPEAVAAVTTLAGMATTAIERGELEDAQRNFFVHVTELLVNALDMHVVGRHGHAGSVARIANLLAHAVSLPRERFEHLHFAAMLHDLGMLRIEPARHRDKKAVRLHATLGARMLARIRLWEPIAPIVLHHHEWFDGSGYPEGKAGEAIPLESRIVAVADAVDAMRRSDGLARGRELPDICRELERGRGTQFDPALVDAFLGLAERGEIPLE